MPRELRGWHAGKKCDHEDCMDVPKESAEEPQDVKPLGVLALNQTAWVER